MGLPEEKRPECQLIGEDGNVFFIIGAVRKALRKAGFENEAEQFVEEATSQKSYDDVLRLCMEYVVIV